MGDPLTSENEPLHGAGTLTRALERDAIGRVEAHGQAGVWRNRLVEALRRGDVGHADP